MAPPPLCLLLLRHGNTLPRLPAQNHIRLLCAGFGDITVLTNRNGVLALFVRNGKDQVQLIISSAPHPRPHAQLEDTHVFEGVFLRLGEEEQNRGEDDDTVQRGEKGVRAPTDIGEHGSGDHDLRVKRSVWAARKTLERRVLTTKKLKSQLEAVDRALAGARILNGVTSAGYSQVIPSQPMENHVLNKNSMRTEKIWATLDVSLYSPARMAMVPACKTVVQSIRGRRPSLSMMKRATRLSAVSSLKPDELRSRQHSRGEEVTCAVDTSDDSRHFRVETHVFQY